jgi:hypothetical protein
VVPEGQGRRRRATSKYTGDKANCAAINREATRLGKVYVSKCAEQQRGFGITTVEAYDGQTEEILAAIGSLKAMLKDAGTVAEDSPFDYESTTYTLPVESHPLTAIFERGPAPRSYLGVLGKGKAGEASSITSSGSSKPAPPSRTPGKPKGDKSSSEFCYDGSGGNCIVTAADLLRDAVRLRGRSKPVDADMRAGSLIEKDDEERPRTERRMVAASAGAAASSLFSGDGTRVLANVRALQRRPSVNYCPLKPTFLFIFIYGTVL